jgi:MFS family permease
VSAQLAWKGTKNIALANDATVIGLMLGSIFASSIVKIGLKNSAILANSIGIVGCIP